MAEEQDQVEAPKGLWEHWKSIALWKQSLVVLSLLMMVGSVGAQAYVAASGSGQHVASAERESPAGGGSEGSELTMGIMPGENEPLDGQGAGAGGEGGPEDPGAGGLSEEEIDVWSPAIFRMGFSFFAGFAIAYALRTFVRVSVISIGVFLLAMFGLQYAGFIEVNWTVIGDRYDSAAGWLSGQFDDFRTFVTGYLPSAAGGAGGMALGFMKR